MKSKGDAGYTPVYESSGPPESHSSTHNFGGTDPVQLAQSQVTGLVADMAAKSPLAGSSSIVTVGTITTGVWAGTAVAVANGGTGATSPSGARAALGLVIGTNVQAYDADLAKQLTESTTITSSTSYIFIYASGTDVVGIVTNVRVVNLSGITLTLSTFGTSPDTLEIPSMSGANFSVTDVDGSGEFTVISSW